MQNSHRCVWSAPESQTRSDYFAAANPVAPRLTRMAPALAALGSYSCR